MLASNRVECCPEPFQMQAATDSGQSVSTVIRAAIKNHLIHY